ncbi:MAG: DUF192 domain-containing protein [Acidimicrobiia bacterium]
MRRPWLGLALTFVLALAACSGDSGTGSTVDASTSSTSLQPPETTTTLPPETTTTLTPPVGVSTDFSRAVVEIDGIPYNVAVADTAEELARGLMWVEDMSPLDGMLFVYDGARHRSHWMKNTLIPLDIAFFDADGWLVSKTTMVPCTSEVDADCASYGSDGLAAFAVEVPAGVFDDLPDDARLAIIGSLDGSGKEI